MPLLNRRLFGVEDLKNTGKSVGFKAEITQGKLNCPVETILDRPAVFR